MGEILLALFYLPMIVVVMWIIVGGKPVSFIKRTNLLGKVVLTLLVLWWVQRLGDSLPEAGDYREMLGRGRGFCTIDLISRQNPSCRYSQDRWRRVIEVLNDDAMMNVVFLGLVAIVGMRRGKKVVKLKR